MEVGKVGGGRHEGRFGTLAQLSIVRQRIEVSTDSHLRIHMMYGVVFVRTVWYLFYSQVAGVMSHL